MIPKKTYTLNLTNPSEKNFSQVKLEKRGYTRPTHQKPPCPTPNQSSDAGTTSSTPAPSSKEK